MCPQGTTLGSIWVYTREPQYVHTMLHVFQGAHSHTTTSEISHGQWPVMVSLVAGLILITDLLISEHASEKKHGLSPEAAIPGCLCGVVF